MSLRRFGALVVLLAGCGPAVGTVPDGTSSGAPSPSTTGDGSSGALATTGTLEGTGNSTSSGPSSSSGPAPQLLEFEGLFRYNAENYKNPISFQTCDGLWAKVDLWSVPGLPRVQLCGGKYVRVLGHLQPSNSIYGGDDLVVHEVIEWRTCEPSDCGGDACEPLTCLWECSPLDQDCARTQRCVPYPTDGGIASAAACVPIPAAPAERGQPCTRDAVGLAADTCGAGAVCMGGFGERAGVCVELCQGSQSNPTCQVGRCVFGNMGAPYCLPECGPRMPACDGVCTGSPVDPFGACVPEPGLPELLEPCDEGSCEDGFVCSLIGPTEGLCVPPP